MTAIVAANGREQALRYLIGDTSTTEELRLRLFRNDVTPDEDSVTGDFTEATFTGYASVLLDTWTVTPGTVPEAVHTLIDFVSSADQTAETIYGYYVVRVTSNDLVAAKRFTGAPYSVQYIGDAISVTPTVSVTGA